MTFDTHKAVKLLKEAGFGDTQAEAVVGTVGDAIAEGVATKTDILELKADIARIETRIEATANRNLIAIIAVGGLIVAALKLL